MTPEEALDLAKTVRETHAAAVTRLVQVISRAVARGVDGPEWATVALREQVRLRDEATTVLRRLRSATQEEVPGLLRLVWDAQASTSNPRATAALAADTLRVLDDAYPRALRWTEDVYRQVVAETVDLAVAGVETRRPASARIVDRLTASGATGFTDTAGRQWRLDTYAEMSARTALGRAHLAGNLDQWDADGTEYVVVSDSPEECPRCRPFEGKVLSLGGDLPPADLGGLAYAGTLGDAVARGLHHPNCTHRESRFVAGLSRPIADTENPQGHQLRQRQRELERRVLDSKRRVAGIRPLGKTPALERQELLLARRRRALQEFNDENGRKAYVSRTRTQLPGGMPPRPGRTTAGSPVSAALTPATGSLALDRRVRHALDRIDSVHGDGALPQLAATRLDGDSLGAYSRRGTDAVGFSVRADGPWPELTTVHEVGHFLDHQALGRRGVMTSEADRGELARVMAAADASDAIRQLRALDPDTTPNPDAARAYQAYLLRRRETWARLYAQYIATRSGDPLLLEQVARVRDAGRGFVRQWTDDDFAPIAEAVDDLMRRKGWRS